MVEEQAWLEPKEMFSGQALRPAWLEVGVANTGRLLIRALSRGESDQLTPALRAKARVAEWLPPEQIRDAQPICFLACRFPEGRRFYLAGFLNPWSSQQEAVGRICTVGYHLAVLNDLLSRHGLDSALVMLFLHCHLLRHMKEFRGRQYKHVRDFRPSASAGVGLMPQYFLDEPVEKIGPASDQKGLDLSTKRTHEFERVAAPVFGQARLSLSSKVAMYVADTFNNRKPPTEAEVWQSIVGSMLVGGIQQAEVERARSSRAAERLIRHLEKVSRKSQDDVEEVFHRIRRQGFRQLAIARKAGGPIDKLRFRRNVLCLMADSFWHLSTLWSAVMCSVKNLVSPPLSGAEETVFDRLYLPQQHLAGLPAFLLWPRADIIRPLTLKLLNTGPQEAWRLNAIPFCLAEFAEMDDYTRQNDLRRKRLGRRMPLRDEDAVVDPQPPPSAVKERLEEVLRGILESRQITCRVCNKPVKEGSFIWDAEACTWEVEWPCGHRLPLDDVRDAGDGPLAC